eukprot:GFUD01004311.1.p1 GENE.GFUD01004311.1~~GFUD01004311.1.p1  ORF type:complete len:527 (+),score=133.15 GFUD01004311.1:142-1722(+)
MGQNFSRHFAANQADADSEEDTSDLIAAQPDTRIAENTETCLQFLRRKLLNLFCCQTCERKKTRSVDEDEGITSNKVTKEDEDCDTEETVTINDVDVETIEEIDDELCIEDTDGEISYLDFPFLVDVPSMSSLRTSLTMIIMRGLPGSGKSTIVSKLREVFPEACICSADDYFVSHGVYTFDRARLKDAHLYSQDKAGEFCQNLANLIIIDNTNVKRWEMAPYFKTASQHRYTVILVEPKTPWKFAVDELAVRNTHGVDESVIRARATDWQVVQPHYYGWFLNPADSSLLLDLGRSWLEKCLANKEFYEDFSQFSNRYNLKSMLHFYSREMMGKGSHDRCHCTSRFIRKGDPMEGTEEVDMCGQASCLHITGFVITPRTFGARIQLTAGQLSVYKQDDTEVESAAVPAKPRSGPASQPPTEKATCASLNAAISACRPSLSTEGDRLERLSGAGPLVGRRAHITLGCADKVRPVQTGLDQLQVLRAMEQPETSLDIPGGTLAGFGAGRWLLSLDRSVEVQAVFSGGF